MESFISMLSIRLMKDLVDFFDANLVYDTLLKTGKKMASIDRRMENADLSISLGVVEDEPISEGNLKLLPKCPFTKPIRDYESATGKAIPGSLKKVMRTANKTGIYAAVTPFCIIHQAFREAVGTFFDKEIKQLGAKSETGEIALASKNIKELGLSEEKIKEKLESNECVYWIS